MNRARFAIFLLLAGAGSGLTPLSAADQTVNTTADELDGSCGDADCSLRDALALVGVGESVLFDLPGSPPWTITILAGLGQLLVDKSISIEGPGASDLILSGNNNVRIMTIQAGVAVTISDLTFRDGRATAQLDKHGGCLKVLGALDISWSRFESCEAWDGGLTSNEPGGDGGAVYVASGATFDGDLLVFEQNDAGLGGGPSTLPPGFRGGFGGGLATAGSTAISRSTVSACRAGDGQGPFAPGGFGGGLAALSGGSLRVDDSTLVGNQSGDGGSFMGGNHGPDGGGGALYCESTCTLNNVTISGNSTVTTLTGTAGGGGGLAVNGGTTRLRNVTVAGNIARGPGGGIARGLAGTILTRNSIFAGNTGLNPSHDCAATAGLVSEGHNLIRINNGCAGSFVVNDQAGTNALPLEPVALGDLLPNGGPTLTRALGAGSLAIDGGDPAGCLAWNGVADAAMPFDQRGEDRETDGDGDVVATCDVGAFEAEAVAPIEHMLEVTLAGPIGGGSVGSEPPGIACPSDCDESYLPSVSVELTATPAADHAFTGWSGDCSGTATCEVDMTEERDVTATFAALHDLGVTLAGNGAGTVVSSPAGVSCPGSCSAPFVDGTAVSLSATPAAGSVFTGYSGACTGMSCNLEMDGDRAVTATFTLLRELVVTLAGTGTGTVSSQPVGISCPGTCSASFVDGVEVGLIATPTGPSIFEGFSGDCTGSTCVLQMTAPRAVTANFRSESIFDDDFETGGFCEWSAVVGAPPCPP